MYVTLNRDNDQIWMTYYDGNCGYFIEDTEENQKLLNFPSHMRYKNKVNLDDDFMRNFWKIVEGNPGRLRLITNALIDVKRTVDGLRRELDKEKVIYLSKIDGDYVLSIDGVSTFNRNFKDLLSRLEEE